MIKTFDLKNRFKKFKNPSLLSLLGLQIIFLGLLDGEIKGQKPESPVSKSITRNLGYYLETGLINSPLLKDNLNQSERISWDSARIRALQKPLVSIGSTAQFYPSINGYGYNQAISNGGNYLATIGFSQPLFNQYSVKAQIHSTRIKRDSLQNSGKISQMEIKKNIINQYILTYADFRQIHFQKDILDLYLDQEKLFKKLVQNGVFKQSDYLTFLVSREAQEINLTQTQISFHNNLSALNSLCGIADTMSYELEKPSLEIGSIRPAYSTFQFHKFEIDSLSLLSQRDIINANYKPKVNWFADAGYESPDFNQFYKSFGTSIGISLSLPLYDGHQKKISNKQIDLDEKTRKGYQDFFKKEYNQQILSLEKQMHDINLLENQLKNQLKNSEMLVDIDKKLLNAGDLKINDLILAINNYKNLEYTLSQIEVNRLILINQLNFWSTQY